MNSAQKAITGRTTIELMESSGLSIPRYFHLSSVVASALLYWSRHANAHVQASHNSGGFCRGIPRSAKARRKTMRLRVVCLVWLR